MKTNPNKANLASLGFYAGMVLLKGFYGNGTLSARGNAFGGGSPLRMNDRFFSIAGSEGIV